MPSIFDPKVTNQQTTQTNASAPWEVQSPYLDYGMQQSKSLYETGGPQYYGYDTYTPMAPQTEQGVTMAGNAAMTGGYGVDAAANAQARDTLSGSYLNSNPYLDQAFNTAADRSRRQMDSQFSSGGRYGSGIHQDLREENLNDMAGKMYGDAYESERGRQMQMASLAPTISNQNYKAADAMIGAGGIVKNQANEQLAADKARWDYNQNQPYANLSNYMSGVTGNYGGTENQVANSPRYSNSTATNILGGATTGLGILDNWDSISKGWDSVSSLWK